MMVVRNQRPVFHNSNNSPTPDRFQDTALGQHPPNSCCSVLASVKVPQLSHRQPKMHLELALAQFQLFTEEVKRSVSIPTL